MYVPGGGDSGFGDGTLDGIQWPAPDGTINLDDINATLFKFEETAD